MIKLIFRYHILPFYNLFFHRKRDHFVYRCTCWLVIDCIVLIMRVVCYINGKTWPCVMKNGLIGLLGQGYHVFALDLERTHVLLWKQMLSHSQTSLSILLNLWNKLNCMKIGTCSNWGINFLWISQALGGIMGRIIHNGVFVPLMSLMYRPYILILWDEHECWAEINLKIPTLLLGLIIIDDAFQTNFCHCLTLGI